jgi:hypothetical protein
MKMLSVALASCLLLASVARPALADGDRATRGESERYAGREAATPVLADFQGGCMSEEMMWFILVTAPIWIALLPVILLAYGVSTLCERKDPPRTKLPPPEQEGQGKKSSQWGPPRTTAARPRA